MTSLIDEINHDKNERNKDYYDKRNELEVAFAKMEKELKEDNRRKFEEEERDLRDKYARMTGEFESEILRIRTMAIDLRDEMKKRIFKSQLAIKLANDIIDFTTKKG